MKQILILSLVLLASSAYSQSYNPLNDQPANVKITHSTSPKKIKEMTIYKADGTNHRKFLYEYNDNNLLSAESEATWDKKNTEWKNYKKETNTYDAAYQLIDKTTAFWYNNNWINKTKKTIAYNTDKRMVEQYYYNWNQNKQEWNSPMTKYAYNYDAKGNRTEYLQQAKSTTADILTDTWSTPNWKVTYTIPIIQPDKSPKN